MRTLSELTVTEQRSTFLLVALRSIYLSLGVFAFAALVSLIGAVLVPLQGGILVRWLEAIAVLACVVVVCEFVHGSTMLEVISYIADWGFSVLGDISDRSTLSDKA